MANEPITQSQADNLDKMCQMAKDTMIGSVIRSLPIAAVVATSISAISSAVAALEADDTTDVESFTAVGSALSLKAVEATVAASFTATGSLVSLSAVEATVAASFTAVGSDISTRAVEATVAASFTAVGSDLSTRAVEATVATSFTAVGSDISTRAVEVTVAASFTAVGSDLSTRAVEVTVAASLTAVGSDLSTRAVEATVAASLTAIGSTVANHITVTAIGSVGLTAGVKPFGVFLGPVGGAVVTAIKLFGEQTVAADGTDYWLVDVWNATQAVSLTVAQATTASTAIAPWEPWDVGALENTTIAENDVVVFALTDANSVSLLQKTSVGVHWRRP